MYNKEYQLDNAAQQTIFVWFMTHPRLPTPYCVPVKWGWLFGEIRSHKSVAIGWIPPEIGPVYVQILS